jgi:serine/threonine-protein kinase
MGLVYRVEHVQLGKIAAMKVLHADTARDADAVRRFRNEAQAVSRLSHPNIVQTFDFGQWDGSLYLVMEYVRGDDLAAVVKRDGPLPFAVAAPLFVQICSALTEAHEAGVIHRDLKPENIVVVVRRAGAPHAKVLDFGLAKLRERTDGAEITSRGQVIGTPYYMSPEQVRSEELDLRTDIYSLGATLYRVLTGTPPFQAATPVGVLAMHVTDPLEPPRRRAPELNLPLAADAIVGRAMAKGRDDRYSTAAEVQHDLERAIQALSHLGAADSEGIASPREPRERAVPQRGRPTPLATTTRAKPPGSVVLDEGDDADDNGIEYRPDREDSVSHSATGDPGGNESRSGHRLRKQDFDEFERSLRRKKLVSSLIVPAGLLCVVFLGVWAFRHNRERASSVEREPNDSAAQATLLPLDLAVQGRIGSRQPAGQPDMDYFRVPAGKGARAISARVEGLSGVDLVLELFDAQGTLLGKSDARGAGTGEWLQPVMVGPGDAYLLVRQVWIQGTSVMENVADPYRLSVHWQPPTPGWEVEPNDWRARATHVELGQAMRGYLGTAEDTDWFSFTPAVAGQLVGRITPPEGVEVAVTVGDSSWAPGGKAAAGAAKAGRWERSVDLKIPARATEPVLVGLTRKLPPGTDPKSRTTTIVGLDTPYELKLDLRAP